MSEATPETPAIETPAVETKVETPEAPETTEVKVETPPKKKIKFKVDGEELEEELGDDDLPNVLAKAKGADKRFQEAADMRDKMMKLFEEGKKAPHELLKQLGIDPRKFAEEFLTPIYQEEELPEPERKRIKAEREAAEYKQRLEQLESEQQKTQSEAEVEKYKGEYDKMISDALSQTNLPRTQGTVKRVAYYMARALEKNIDDFGVNDAVALVKEDYAKEHGELYKSMTEDELLAIIGEDKARALAKKLATMQQKPENRADNVESNSTPRHQKKMQWNEFADKLDKTLQGMA